MNQIQDMQIKSYTACKLQKPTCHETKRNFARNLVKHK